MRSIGLAACLAVGGCSDDLPHECAAASCGGLPPRVELVDAAGNRAAVRGELRGTGPWDALEVGAFDCSRPPGGNALQRPQCGEGGLLSLATELRPDWRLELRFELQDGSWSEWRRLILDIATHTDPEFNGPGCPCTWYTATAEPFVVPADALLPAP